jgi:Kef-type K+ transport system membrane component KefB
LAHGDPVAPLLLALAVILVAAKLGGHLAARLGQPAVLGELVMGVVLGNLHFVGFSGLDHFKADPTVDMLSRLGVILLLFSVGLESTVAQMRAVGLSSLLVATVGVITPFVLGWGVGALLLPDAGAYVHAFLGATLTATSVGITARVLSDLGKTDTREARIILGAAVIDDVMGLVILAVMSGAIAAAASGQGPSYGSLFLILARAVLFLAGALVVGARLSPMMFRLASREIIDRGEHELEELVAPIAAFLIPIFFVVMGMRTDLASFADAQVLTLAAALTVAAVIGKQVCGLAVVGGGIDRVTVGLGMIPRGEVGLIFANMGMALTLAGVAILTPPLYSAIVVMVIVTTLITPPALKWSLGRAVAREGPAAPPANGNS